MTAKSDKKQMVMQIDNTFRLPPEMFEAFARSANGDPRSVFRVGNTLKLEEIGTERELHVHLSMVSRAPDEGGKVSFGITVLPFDARWNRLWSLAQQEVPMLRAWLWGMMTKANEQIDQEQFLAAQYEEPA